MMKHSSESTQYTTDTIRIKAKRGIQQLILKGMYTNDPDIGVMTGSVLDEQ